MHSFRHRQTRLQITPESSVPSLPRFVPVLKNSTSVDTVMLKSRPQSLIRQQTHTNHWYTARLWCRGYYHDHVTYAHAPKRVSQSSSIIEEDTESTNRVESMRSESNMTNLRPSLFVPVPISLRSLVSLLNPSLPMEQRSSPGLPGSTF